MSDDPKKEPPESVRRIAEAMARRAIAECARLGIDPLEFHRVMQEEQKDHPEISMAELFQRTFRRLGVTAN